MGIFGIKFPEFLVAWRIEAMAASAILALLSLLLILYWLRRADRGLSEEERKKPFFLVRIWRWLVGVPRRVYQFFKFLLTPRKWLYRDAWYLMLCEPEGRDTLLDALDAGGRQFVSRRERKMSGAAGTWHFYRGCAVIETTAGETEDLSEEEAWRSLIERVQDYRPERPLDGLLLVLPLKLLRQAAQPEERSSAQMAMQAYARRMSEISSRYGFVLPYYIVVKDCEGLDGFDALYSALDDNERGQMLGWSRQQASPVSPDVERGPIEEGFESIISAVSERVTVLAASGKRLDTSRLLVLPRELENVHRGLEILMRPIIQEIREAGLLNLRGVYLSGQGSGDAAPSFLTDMIGGKVVPEANLAVPTGKSLLSANRRIRWYQLGTAATVLALASWLLADTLSLRDQSESVAQQLHRIERYNNREYSQETAVEEILRGMSRMEARPLVRASMPISYLRLPGRGVIDYLGNEKLGDVIAPALECKLRERGINLLEFDDVALLNWLDQVNYYLYQLDVFRELTLAGGANEEQSLDDLVTLVEGLYGGSVPASLYRNSELYEAALSSFEHRLRFGFPLCEGQGDGALDWKAEFSHRATVVSEHYIQHEVSSLKAIPESQDAGSPLGFLDQLRDLMAGEKLSPDLASGLRRFAAWYDDAQDTWLNPDLERHPCRAATTELLRMQENLDAFDKGERTEAQRPRQVKLQDALEVVEPEGCDAALAEVSNRNFDILGAAFVTDAEGEVQFSDNAAALREVVEPLLYSGFFQAPTDNWWLWREDAQYVWSAELLQRALDYYAEYEELALLHFGRLIPATDVAEPNLTGQLLAMQQLRVVMEAAIGAAQVAPDGFQPGAGAVKRPVDINEQQVATRVKAFTSSLELLLRIDGLFQRLGMVAAHEQLQSTVSGYAIALLEDINTLTMSGRLYALADKPSFQADSVMSGAFRKTPEQLPGWLRLQRDRANHVARVYAEPVVTFLMNAEPRHYRGKFALFELWLATVKEANAASDGGGSSSMQALEDYIAVTLGEASWASCNELDPVSAGAQDLFTATRQRIAGRVAGLCRGFYNQSTLEDYQLLADSFNTSLRYRYPFVGTGERDEGDASLADVRRFFARYNKLRPGLLDQMRAQGSDAAYAAAAEFIENMDGVAALFSTGIESNVPITESGLGLTLRFRGGAPLDDYAANIKLWRVHSGAYSASSPGQDSEFIWQFGAPFEVSLSWADTAPVAPVLGRGVDSVRGRTAYYRDNSTWSLMRLVDRHRSSLPDLDGEGRELVLNFVTPLRGVGEAELDSDARSNAFIRLGIYRHSTEDGSQELLSWPREFPAYAPTVPGGAVAANQ